jgi:predicted dehydrogenase
VLGTSGIARAHVVPAIQASANGRVTAVAGRDLARTKEFAAAFGISETFGDYAELLASPEVDAVYVPLPNNLHPEWSLRALETGRRFCAKSRSRSMPTLRHASSMPSARRACR